MAAAQLLPSGWSQTTRSGTPLAVRGLVLQLLLRRQNPISLARTRLRLAGNRMTLPRLHYSSPLLLIPVFVILDACVCRPTPTPPPVPVASNQGWKLGTFVHL